MTIPPSNPPRSTPVRERRADGTGRRRGVPIRAAGLLLAAVLPACGGGLGYRSYADVSGKLPIGQVSRVRIEIQDGRIEIHAGGPGEIAYRGGVRRAGDTDAALGRLEQLPLVLSAAVDPVDPTLLVVRGPMRDASGPPGVFAYELAIHVPADVAVDLRIRDNGEVAVVGRRAATDVSTGRGDLRFEACAGPLRGRTGRGNVLVEPHRGDLDVMTKVGNIQAFVREPGTQLRLGTGEGTVQCHVPRALDFEIDARAETGKAVATAFGLESQTVGRFGAVLTGVRGAGTTKIVLRTGSGHLSLSPLGG